MLGGFDIAGFVCNRWQIDGHDFDLAEQEGFRSWKEKTVERLSPGGYVDEACVPNPLLTTILKPLRDSDYVVMEGLPPEADATYDPRTFCMFIRGNVAAYVYGVLGKTHNIRLASYARPQWNRVLMKTPGIEGCYAPASQDATACLSDTWDDGFLEMLLRAEDEKRIRAFARQNGCDFHLWMESAHRVRGAGERLVLNRFCVFDFTRGAYDTQKKSNPYTVHARTCGDFRVRSGLLLPIAGFMFSICAVRRPRSGEHAVEPGRNDPPSEYLSLDWLHERTLIDVLLDIPPYPEELADDPWEPGQDALHPVDRRW